MLDQVIRPKQVNDLGSHHLSEWETGVNDDDQ